MNYLKNERKHIFYSILLGLAGSLVGVSIFGLSGYMIGLSFFDPPIFVIIIIIAVIKLCGMIKGAFKYFERLLSHDATFHMIGRLRLKFFQDTMETSKNTHSVRFIQTLNQRFEQVEDYYIRIIYPYVIAVLFTLLMTLFAVIIGWQLSLVMIGVGILTLYVLPKIFEPGLYNLNQEARKDESSAYLKVYHYIHNHIDLFVNKKIDQSESSIAQALGRIEQDRIKMTRLESGLQFLSGLVQIAAMIFIIIIMENENSLLVPMVLLLLIGFFDVINPVIMPRTNYKSVSEAVKDVSSTKEKEAHENRSGTIELNHMHYRYPGTKKDAIADINMTVKEGEKHVIIGSSGSGKTTILNQMIERIEAGVMPQHLDFYNATIRDNLTMFGHFKASEAQINSLLKRFGLDIFQPDDMIDYIGQLSGGERKRMHLIRMILEDKSWWLLDEPTANLNESLRDKVWQEIFDRKTVVVSTHDLSHLERFDVIHFIEEGRIRESGTFEEVIQAKGKTYQSLMRYADNL